MQASDEKVFPVDHPAANQQVSKQTDEQKAASQEYRQSTNTRDENERSADVPKERDNIPFIQNTKRRQLFKWIDTMSNTTTNSGSQILHNIFWILIQTHIHESSVSQDKPKQNELYLAQIIQRQSQKFPPSHP